MEIKNFITDSDKMQDFLILTEEEFLKSYSYLTQEEYDKTKEEIERIEKIIGTKNFEIKNEFLNLAENIDNSIIIINKDNGKKYHYSNGNLYRCVD